MGARASAILNLGTPAHTLLIAMAVDCFYRDPVACSSVMAAKFTDAERRQTFLPSRTTDLDMISMRLLC